LIKLCTWPSHIRVHVLRSLGVLEKYLVECLGSIVLPSHMAILLACHIAASYAALRLYHSSSFLVYLVWPLIFVMATIFQAVGYTISASLLENAKIQLETSKRLQSSGRKYLIRQFRSVRPIRIDISYFFEISKSTLFNFWRSVIENTITVLLI